MPNCIYNDSPLDKRIKEMMPAICPYTTREVEVLTLLCNLYNNKEISKLLSISQGTVKRHVENMRLKSGCKSSMELVVCAIGSKWVSL